jgi:hypothetical protein
VTQVQLPKIRRKVLGDQLQQRLDQLPGAPTVTVYRGEVPTSPPVLPDSDRIAPYVVLFDGTGPVNLEPDLAGVNEDLRWTPQITVAAAFSPDCAQLVDRVFAWVHRWSPVIENVAAGGLVPPPGFDPGGPRADRQVSPPRFFVPLQWQLDLTT